MGNIIRLMIIIINIVLYNYTNIENIDIFVSNLLILNLLSYCGFIYFDDFKNRNTITDNIKVKSNLKSIIFSGLKKEVKNTFNWIVLLFPLTFYFTSSLNHTFSEKQILFYVVMIVFLSINIIVLSTLIKREYYKNYSIYIVALGILFQNFTSFFSNSYKDIATFLIGMILLTYLCIIFFGYSYRKNESKVSS